MPKTLVEGAHPVIASTAAQRASVAVLAVGGVLVLSGAPARAQSVTCHTYDALNETVCSDSRGNSTTCYRYPALNSTTCSGSGLSGVAPVVPAYRRPTVPEYAPTLTEPYRPAPVSVHVPPPRPPSNAPLIVVIGILAAGLGAAVALLVVRRRKPPAIT